MFLIYSYFGGGATFDDRDGTKNSQRQLRLEPNQVNFDQNVQDAFCQTKTLRVRTKKVNHMTDLYVFYGLVMVFMP